MAKLGRPRKLIKVSLPHNWYARDYQLPLLEALQGGIRRAVCVWHRRAGKDLTVLNWTIPATQARRGTYFHLLPTYNQGRKILWDGMDKTGRPYLDYFPKELIARKSEVEMQLELTNGSIWQVIGGDDPNRLVGTNPVGCVFSEFSLQNPDCWEYLRPILAENGGWAVFLYTPRGRNHAWDLYKTVQGNPEWFVQTLTVEDTGAVPLAVIESERQAGMSDEMIQQEFFCSFNAPQFGAYYGKEMTAARGEGRICRFEPSATALTHTAWDLGFDDYMVIWWYQISGREIHVIDYHEASGEGLAYYVRVLQEKKEQMNLLYGDHWAPHDIDQGEFSTGKTRKQTARELGIEFKVVPRTANLGDDIEMVRQLLPRCWFRLPAADMGVTRLENYRKAWDAKREIFQDRPLHDINSHGADGFRTLAGAVRMNKLFVGAPVKPYKAPHIPASQSWMGG